MRTLPAPPGPRCGSTDTYADAIEVPTSLDPIDADVPVIRGTMHCRACETTRDPEAEAMRLAHDIGLTSGNMPELDLVAKLVHHSRSEGRSYVSLSPADSRQVVEWLRQVGRLRDALASPAAEHLRRTDGRFDELDPPVSP